MAAQGRPGAGPRPLLRGPGRRAGDPVRGLRRGREHRVRERGHRPQHRRAGGGVASAAGGTWPARTPTRTRRGCWSPATPAGPTASGTGPGKPGWPRWRRRPGWRSPCCHFPPGTSKWNKIEHRLFCQITLAWRGRPLTSYDVIVNTIAAVTTRTGLTVTAVLDDNPYPDRAQVSDEQMNRHRRPPFNTPRLPRRVELRPRARPPARPRTGTSGPRRRPARLCDPAALDHPALTGMDPAALTALAAALDSRSAARREQRRYPARGAPAPAPAAPRLPTASSTSPATCSPSGSAPHLNLPAQVIGALLGADAHHHQPRHQPHRQPARQPAARRPPAAPPPAIRLRTLDDLRGYAARHGITIPGRRPQPAHPRRAHYKPPARRQLT